MRLVKFVVVFPCLALVTIACKKEVKMENSLMGSEVVIDSEENIALIETANFEVEGMTCELGCAKLIQNRLASLNGVRKASVDFETKKAIVEFDKSKQSSETIIKTVEKIANGIYKVEKMTLLN